MLQLPITRFGGGERQHFRWRNAPMFMTGVVNLDLILGGGIPEGDMLLVVGPAGSGKTTLCLQMAFHTVARGDRVVFASTLSESPNRLLKHTRGFSFYDERAVGGQLRLLSVYPMVKRGLAGVSEALVEAVEEHGAKLLVLDGFMTLRDLHPEAPERRRGYVTALAGILRDHGVTALHTLETAQVVGPELGFSHTAVAVLSENLLLMRNVEFRGVRLAVVSILTMRESAYDPTIRQYVITGEGVSAVPPEDMPEGMLAAIARLPGGGRWRWRPPAEGGA